MAKPVEPTDLDKVVKSVEAAMKTDATKAKLREEQRKKAEAELEAFKDNYAGRQKEIKARDKRAVDSLEKADGIAENELDKEHPLVARLHELIGILKKIPRDGQYEDLNKAINALEDWDVELEKTDMPKKAIKHLQQAKAVLTSWLAEVDKGVDEYIKVLAAVRKDVDTVEDPDVKKRLKAILDQQPK